MGVKHCKGNTFVVHDRVEVTLRGIVTRGQATPRWQDQPLRNEPPGDQSFAGVATGDIRVRLFQKKHGRQSVGH